MKKNVSESEQGLGKVLLLTGLLKQSDKSIFEDDIFVDITVKFPVMKNLKISFGILVYLEFCKASALDCGKQSKEINIMTGANFVDLMMLRYTSGLFMEDVYCIFICFNKDWKWLSYFVCIINKTKED
ncbi:hypothetical protein BpHYR1_032321 [Brachionus plicatilis]|uniref:Uncharacterized protein n=1 Tax=Brachionus plicatilis TaxID=10195 RepID=A0A3M7T0J4_BRAPC|nr:hypothetical protein BpHYR1_032321 [Brachionus plicatilis]